MRQFTLRVTTDARAAALAAAREIAHEATDAGVIWKALARWPLERQRAEAAEKENAELRSRLGHAEAKLTNLRYALSDLMESDHETP